MSVPATDLITFNRPYATGREFGYIAEAIENRHLSGNGPFGARCASWLEERLGAARVLLTGSCTSALELAVLLLDLAPGDEVIMPSFTFVSTASAVALRGAVPVFCDIDPDTLCLDPAEVADAITPRTKAILPVHYAGVGCDMEALCSLGPVVLEDAAHALLASRGGRALGSWGALAGLSFHETKNVICGEGGALVVNDPRWVERAEILQEKGTNRAQFFRGQVDRYTWVDLGSSFLQSEVNAAFLWAQLEEADDITARRLDVWDRYHNGLADLEARGRLRRPVIPPGCTHNGHLYHVLVGSGDERDALIAHLREHGVQAVFHYVPLHSAPAGQRYGRPHGDLRETTRASERLVRLPLWVGLGEAEVDRVLAALESGLR